MFKLSAEPRFKHTVTIKTPVDGGHSDETVDVTYRVIKTSDAAKYDLTTGAGSLDFLKAVVVAIDGVQNEAGAAEKYTDALRDRLLEIPYVRSSLAIGYFDAIGKASQGN